MSKNPQIRTAIVQVGGNKATIQKSQKPYISSFLTFDFMAVLVLVVCQELIDGYILCRDGDLSRLSNRQNEFDRLLVVCQ
jgi:hypothetical protein